MTPEISSFKVIVSPAKLPSFSCILGHLLNIKAIEAFQIIIIFGLNMSCQTRMCFKLKDITLALTYNAEMLINIQLAHPPPLVYEASHRVGPT